MCSSSCQRLLKIRRVWGCSEHRIDKVGGAAPRNDRWALVEVNDIADVNQRRPRFVLRHFSTDHTTKAAICSAMAIGTMMDLCGCRVEGLGNGPHVSRIQTNVFSNGSSSRRSPSSLACPSPDDRGRWLSGSIATFQLLASLVDPES